MSETLAAVVASSIPVGAGADGLCPVHPPDHEPRPCAGGRCSLWVAGHGRCLLELARERAQAQAMVPITAIQCTKEDTP